MEVKTQDGCVDEDIMMGWRLTVRGWELLTHACWLSPLASGRGILHAAGRLLDAWQGGS